MINDSLKKRRNVEAGKQTGCMTNTHSLFFIRRRVSQNFSANFPGIAARYWSYK